jgi:hypothetical protein
MNVSDQVRNVGNSFLKVRQEKAARHLWSLALEVRKLEAWVSMFTIDHLEGMFNHYMEMQKQAFHNQSGDSTIAFWHDRAKKQREIIDAFEDLTTEGERK